ncbi:hypothetical protein HK102_010274 [Quaeritorhiza haematococci]|nr:hypothetical protein HK102_010274 [Quaeritorhiza haematococci]
MTFRGAVQLILYRIIDQELLIQSSDVNGPLSLLSFLVFNYLVYLQVSGQFHVACGMLHMFGYQLPDTHHRYLLATGFTDYWRRINIYWKDFMVRLVFNPVVFRLKRWPQPAALAAATAVVFFVTWLLHGYQSFWLRGTWGFTAPASRPGSNCSAAASGLPDTERTPPAMALIQSPSIAAARVAMAQAAALVALSLIPIPAGWTQARRLMASASSNSSNRADADHHATGYYEGLVGGAAGPGGRGELTLKLMGKPNGWVRFNDAGVVRHLDRDFLQFELIPEIDSVLFGQPFVTNSHGMHGPEVALEKPPGVFRIALLGASMDMGWGVKYQDSYAHQLQEWLNTHAAHQGFASDRRFEVLNFAVAAYSPLQRLESFRRKAKEFQPDLVVFASTMLDSRLAEIHLCDVFRTQAEIPFDFARRAVERAGVTEADRRLDSRKQLVAKEPVARLRAIAGRQALPIYDLTDTFDQIDPALLEIAAWDDHPNAVGHHRLFLALTHKLVTDQGRYELLFPGRSAVAEAALPEDLP